jgi:hypothetical protein
MTGKPPTHREHDKRRVQLAHRISEVENIPFAEASRLIPDDPEALRALVDNLNARRGAPRNTAERKISAANRRSGRTGEDFTTAARHVK